MAKAPIQTEKIETQSTIQGLHQTFDWSTKEDRLGTVSWSHPTVVVYKKQYVWRGISVKMIHFSHRWIILAIAEFEFSHGLTILAIAEFDFSHG